jgi:hypothetical protein
LPDYLGANPVETAEWDVVFDARGHFTEPHTGKTFGLGTLEVREYLTAVEAVQAHTVGLEEMAAQCLVGYRFPTCGPRYRYGAILFIEKEGFMPLFAAAKLKERFDLAIMSSKGLSNTATRTLVDQLCRLAADGVPLFVLHDFDKAGFSILGTFRRNTRRYSFKNEVNVIDAGLRLEDVEAYRLESEEVLYRGNPRPNLRQNGATEKEMDLLCEPGTLRGRRVELNAFTSAELVAWLEGKLTKHGVRKVVPEAAVLEAAFRASLQARLFERRAKKLVRRCRAEAEKAELPEGLASKVSAKLASEPALAWDTVVAGIARLHAKPKAE